MNYNHGRPSSQYVNANASKYISPYDVQPALNKEYFPNNNVVNSSYSSLQNSSNTSQEYYTDPFEHRQNENNNTPYDSRYQSHLKIDSYMSSNDHFCSKVALPYGRLNLNPPLPMHETSSKSDYSKEVFSNSEELELLEELGIDPKKILRRLKSVLFFKTLDTELVEEFDLCGPLAIAICLASLLLLCGKVHFEYIYGLSVTGCLSMYILLTLMSQTKPISLYSTISILGYGLMPIVFLACISILVHLRNYIGTIISLCCILWSTATASRFIENIFDMSNQRYLVAYPISILYGCFVLITVF